MPDYYLMCFHALGISKQLFQDGIILDAFNLSSHGRRDKMLPTMTDGSCDIVQWDMVLHLLVYPKYWASVHKGKEYMDYRYHKITRLLTQ